MSVTIQNEIDKAKVLTERLRKKQNEVASLGITTSGLDQLEQMVQELKASDDQVEEMRKRLTMTVRENNCRVAEMKAVMLNLRRIVKSNYEQPRWIDFGVQDKR